VSQTFEIRRESDVGKLRFVLLTFALVGILPVSIARADCSATPPAGASSLDNAARPLLIGNGRSEDRVTYAATPPLQCGAKVQAELGSDVPGTDGGGVLNADDVTFTPEVTASGALKITATIKDGARIDGGKYTAAVSVTGVSLTNAPTIEIDRKDYSKGIAVAGIALIVCLLIYWFYRGKFPPPAGASSTIAATALVIVAGIGGLVWLGIASQVVYAPSWAADGKPVASLFAESMAGFVAGVSFISGTIKAFAAAGGSGGGGGNPGGSGTGGS
jgi:hypothetical protein